MKEEAFKIIDQSHEEMLELWQELVNVECGIGCKPGIDEIGVKLGKLFEAMGGKIRIIPFQEAGNMLVAEFGDMSKPFLLMTGHMDTVFSYGAAIQRPFKIEDGKAYGPGCLDMKGGIVIMYTALKALKKCGWDKYPVKVVLMGDEEVGHAKSEGPECLAQEAAGAKAAFNFETGFPDGGIVVERKGMLQFQLEVTGRGAHVGNDPENGRSAIKEIAHKLLEIEDFTDWNKGNTYNVGVIEGGTVCNACPAYARIICDLRFVNSAYLEEEKSKIKAIAAKTYIPDTVTKLTQIVEFKEMRRLDSTMELLEVVKEASLENGFGEVYPRAVGGASDSAYTTLAGVPTVCAMGVQGGRNHTVEEFAIVDTMYTRAKLLIATLLKL